MKVYEVVTERILAMLEAGTVPWKTPWKHAGRAPKNLSSDRHYSGINWFLLSCAGNSPYWLTYKQAAEMGGQVRKGEKGMPVIFYSWFEDSEQRKAAGKMPFMVKYYTVFNACQIDGVEIPDLQSPPRTNAEKIAACESILTTYANPPKLEHSGTRACYSPRTDIVNMPPANQFFSDEEYYGTLFHELAHSTGHTSRLNRDLNNEHGSTGYGEEELTAEMTAAFICAETGIAPKLEENSAAYIASWLKIIRGNSRLVVTAAQRAQKAANLMLGRKAEYKTESAPVAEAA